MILCVQLKAIIPAVLLGGHLAMAATPSLYDIPLKDIQGNDTSLKEYEGKVLLIVNVASKCGNTPQYAGLEKLYKEYKDQGLVVLGFPCNDFGAQEPGTNEEIIEFCSRTYGVSFPMFDKLHVKGPEQHPLYAVLAGKGAPFPGDVTWNFEKFIVGRNGNLKARFNPRTVPEDPEFVRSLEAVLKSGL